RTVRAADFPGVADWGDAPWFTLPEETLRTMIRQTAFAAASDASRAFLTGVLMEVDEEGVRFVATDSNRLALREVRPPEPAKEPGKALVPARALQELLRILQEEEDPVSVALWNQQVGFRVGGTRLVSRLIEGQFPNYRYVIPQESDVTFRLP